MLEHGRNESGKAYQKMLRLESSFPLPSGLRVLNG